jgi:phosphatidylserine/phosphatidylglycerophosphate/cardiolipin synthase-like enzyme
MNRLARAVALLLLFASTARADLLRILDDPSEAMQARVDVMQQATSDISALYFLARNDRVTLTSLALLREARRRGVGSVRLVVDANFTRIPKPVLAHLRNEGVQIRVYHPTDIRHPSWLFRRMHEKVIVIDGRRYITGGRNLAESYFALARRNYVDREVYVEGDSAGDAMRHFEAVWASDHLRKLRVRVGVGEVARASAVLDAALSELRKGEGFVRLDAPRDWSSGAREVGPVRFLHDPVSPRGVRVGNRLSEILEEATTSIVIESPYLVPSRPVRELLNRKLSEGVVIVIVTNSIHSTDGVFPHAAYVKYRRSLLKAGVDLREYKGPDMLHAKSMVVDGRIIGIGSYNLDPRSQNLNTEVMCVAEDERVAEELMRSITTHMENAWVVGDGGKRERRVSRARAVRAWAARMLVLLPIVESQI